MTAPDLDKVIGALPNRPPVPARSMAEVAKRATRLRRARRRRRTLGAGALLAVVILGALVVVDRDQGAVELDVAGPTTTVGSEGTAPASPTDAELRARPAGHLTDGQSITVTGSGFPPGARITMSQCERRAPLEAATAICDLNALQNGAVDAAGGFRVTYTVRRVIRTSNGIIDCAEAPGPCVMAVAILPSGPVASVELTFDPAGPSPSSGHVSASQTDELRDDQPVSLRGTGFRAGDELHLSQCAVQDPDPYAVGCPGYDTAEVSVEVDDSGAFTTTFPVQRLLFRSESVTGGFEDCAELSGGCELRIGGLRANPIRLPIGFDTNEPRPTEPSLTVDNPPPLTLLQEVTVRGKDFQPGMNVRIGPCRFPEGEASDSTTCSYPDTVSTRADTSGSFTVTMPLNLPFSCTEAPGRCGLAYYPGNETPAYARLPLELEPVPPGE